ncbi:helix-turn-helix domain-containing protein [Phycicoccus sp. HDW14]|uniref:helix-turn-helix domain-containing protein n=1 Tax=Phycicoccus sp. HDW14 TaxID=2714941 RepID=UPI0014076970|nr:helix-turn-helix domain-containing protein [Phycicoccus sp. HDW14]QIM22140.1 helix-turn-helix domain-containing protein [Phycicoccus sp. HDW14]
MERTPKLYSAEEAAEMLGLKRRKVWNLAASGRLEHHRIDRQLRFTLAQIEAFLASTVVPADQGRKVPEPSDLRSMRAAAGSRRRRGSGQP